MEAQILFLTIYSMLMHIVLAIHLGNIEQRIVKIQKQLDELIQQ